MRWSALQQNKNETPWYTCGCSKSVALQGVSLHYPGTVTLSPANLQLTAPLIRRHLDAIGSLWRKLDPGQQALLALVYLRKHETYAALAEG